LFSADQYIKYWSWMMSDRSPLVRKEVLTGILSLFLQDEEKNGGIHGTALNLGFSKKILRRLLEMTQDKNVHVVTLTIEILTLLYSKGILNQENIGRTHDLQGKHTCCFLAEVMRMNS
jgi:hypothetical protein